MSKVRITVGGAMEDEASRRFVDAWHRAERGETFHERHLAFESWETLARVLTGKRMELLSYVRHNDVTSVRALAKALKRDYSNVHADVKVLASAGLLDATANGVRAEYDVIATKIAIREGKSLGEGCGIPPFSDEAADGRSVQFVEAERVDHPPTWATCITCDDRWPRDCWAMLPPSSGGYLAKWQQLKCVTLVNGRPMA